MQVKHRGFSRNKAQCYHNVETIALVKSVAFLPLCVHSNYEIVLNYPTNFKHLNYQ